MGSINDKSSSTVSQDLEDAGVVIPEWKYPLSDDEAEDHRGNIDHSATSDNFGMDIWLTALRYRKILVGFWVWF